ncbi:Retrovirus-related Pol polyprotein from transposon TNT 1-94 [Bienertia sinuspersici]
MIDGTLPMPSPFLSDNTGRDHINPDYYLWLKIDQIVRSWLFATLHRDILVEVHYVKFSTPIWERLQSRFMSASLARSMELKRTLSFIQKSQSQSMDQYLRDIKVLVDSLAAINSPVSLPDLIQYTLNGLGPDYDSLVTTILHFPGHLTFDELRSKLLVQEQRIHALQAGSSSSQHPAFAASQSTPTSSSNSSTASTMNNNINNSNRSHNNNHGRHNNNNWRGRGNRNNNRNNYNWRNRGNRNSTSSQGPPPSTSTGSGSPSVEGVLGSNPPIVCQICFHPGHSAQSCPSRYAPQSTPALAAMPVGETNESLWYPDSSASSHMTNNEGSTFWGGTSSL